jgi:Spy/CpxP family protein refolding chaperone
MFATRITAAATTAIAAAAVALAVSTAGGAAASTTDDDFLAQMKSVGISFDSPAAGVQEGHQVCKELAAGKTGSEIAREVLSQTDLTAKQAASFVVGATKAYCPELSSQLT